MYQQPYEWNKDKLGIPIYTESETKLNRVPVGEVYEQILSDIDKGYNYLKGKGISKKDELNEYATVIKNKNTLLFSYAERKMANWIYTPRICTDLTVITH